MVENNLSTHIVKYLESYFQDTDLFLVDIKVSAKDKVQVYIDKASTNVNIDTCAKVSRYLENELEENGLVQEHYTIEVSSPGMSNPFKVMQQYEKNVGRHVQVITNEYEEMNGILKAANEDRIVLEVHEKVMKKMPPEIKTYEFPFEELKSVKKKITFK